MEPVRDNKGLLLLVDDEPVLLRGWRRLLELAGFTVEAVSDGEAAERLLGEREYDAILSDIGLPGLSGVDLLSKGRSRDPDLAVILMTGDPAVETAQRAVEHGALRYLVKPVAAEDLVQTVEQAVKVSRMARIRRKAMELAGDPVRLVADRVDLNESFTRALSSLWMAYQPIVSWGQQKVFAMEALLRTREPLIPHPGAFLDAAERLKRLPELGQHIRARAALDLQNAPEDLTLFVNLHPEDLLDPSLYDDNAPLTPFASRVVLEVTERAALDHIPDVSERVRRLRGMGYRIALDDLGAGYAGLSCFAQLEPDVVKLDMSFVRDVAQQPVKQRLIHSMVSLCRDMGMKVIAEGIETEEERDTVVALGVDLLQGYLFCRPSPAFPTVQFAPPAVVPAALASMTRAVQPLPVG